MKAAFAAWDDRVAPVFDVAREIHLVEVRAGGIVAEGREVLADQLPAQRALRLVELGANTLVCGAISRPMQALVSAYGIEVIAFVAGDLREVIQAWLSGGLPSGRYAMPGCCGRSRRRRCGRAGNQEERAMLNVDSSAGGTGGAQGRGRQGAGGRGGGGQGGRGQGQGGGRGQGQGRGRGQGPGRMGGPTAAGPGGICVCAQCGYQEPHKLGRPCPERVCPQCGAPLTRPRSS